LPFFSFLQHVESDKVICLASCHLWWEPSAVLVREYQLQFLLMKIKEANEQLGYKFADTPTFICGDLNEELHESSKLQQLFTKLGYLSSYTLFFNQIQEKESNIGSVDTNNYYTIYTPKVKGAIDAIMYTAKHVTPTCVLSLPTESELKAECGSSLPTEQLPSDHLFVTAKFNFIQN